ncbi:lipase [Coniochaeta ligniaria NRRL 30616]|uniref:Lipase n=1 Tax=Coniochaeta ligniaria NRRL 30616 TaxID=1408157 RepID=A0A1J7IS37_9PEZI|nr:lipase [Coniochaeta ligniaria NRRL 30616]
MRFFSQYAGAAYCNSQNSVGQAVTCAGSACPTVTSNGAKTAKTFSGILTDIQGLIAVDPTTKQIVVTFRGSKSVRNWISNIVFAFSDCSLVSGCQVHTGFSAAWGEVSSAVTSGVAAAKKANPGYAVVATGHSLGGAVATLAAAYLRASGTAVDLYTYGSPRVGNDAFAGYVSAQSGLEVRVTHLDDPVPRLPPLLFGYRHTSPEYWLSDGSATTTAYGVSDVKVCAGSANTDCNAGTGGLDIFAHLYYLGPISGCSSGFDFRKRDEAAPLTDAQLEDRLNMFTALDIQLAAAIANGTTT